MYVPLAVANTVDLKQDDIMIPEVYVMASGTKTGGGSGFRNLVEASRLPIRPMRYKVAGVICNIRGGGVEKHARDLGIPFHHFEGVISADNTRRWDAIDCYRLIGRARPYIMMSGWLKLGKGYDPQLTTNIHPGPTSMNLQGERPFAGKGMYGHHVHEAVMDAYDRGEIQHTEVTIHAVTDEADAGVPIARIPVLIHPHYTAGLLATHVNKVEHQWQPIVLEAWLNGQCRILANGTFAETPFPH
jgi:phosphoribosylglycinamide formyltransferase 1